jgi:hypothetical protein
LARIRLMGQQPNVEVTESMLPRTTPAPGAAGAWRAAKPGLSEGPHDIPSGPGFGTAGPDQGWAYGLVDRADLPDEDPRLKSVVLGLVMARAAALGRAPIPTDIAAALMLCGYGEPKNSDLAARRGRWLAAVPHEKRPGATAVGEVDRDLLRAKPEQIRYAHRLSEKA